MVGGALQGLVSETRKYVCTQKYDVQWGSVYNLQLWRRQGLDQH